MNFPKSKALRWEENKHWVLSPNKKLQLTENHHVNYIKIEFK